MGPLFHRILCAADLTDSSTRTVDLALSLAQENLARLTLLHVVEGRMHENVATPHPVAAEGASLARHVREARLQQLENLVDVGSHGFCEVTRRVESGTPWREILKVADEINADLIVVGAHASGCVRRAFLGATANQVVRHADCPVLVAREMSRRGSQAEAKSAHTQAMDAAVHD